MNTRTLAAAALALVAATAAADTAVYDLDAKNAKEIKEALQSVLLAQCQQPGIGTSNPNACRAELLPTGQLLVAAPDAAQAQVAAVIKAIAARNATPTPRVTLEYWVIYGEPRKPDATNAALKQLASVLQQLERTHGELGFSVLDSTALTTQSGTNAGTHGGALQINQHVGANADSVSVAIQLTFSPLPADANAAAGADSAAEAVAAAAVVAQSLNVEVTIRRGEYLVLGERTAGEPAKSGRLFYVVHWPQGQ
ncbi:MAG TPA: hypothetical protein VE907_11655 [Gammaproteobacteria bacterium]|nr:hypothetical protein [Gammaproteobacteria bacterium]